MSRCGPTPHGFIIWILSPRPLSSRALSAWTLYPIALHMTAEPGSSTKTGGGVLEIPADYIIEDDLWQAKISFHGTHAWSPDSTILVSFYAGFQCLDKEEFTESILESLEEDGFTVFLRDEKEEVLTVFARSRRGSPRLAHGTDQAGSRGQLRADGLRRVPHPPGGQGPARRQGQVHRGIPTDRSQILKEPCT